MTMIRATVGALSTAAALLVLGTAPAKPVGDTRQLPRDVIIFGTRLQFARPYLIRLPGTREVGAVDIERVSIGLRRHRRGERR